MDIKGQRKLLLLGPIPPPWSGHAVAVQILLKSTELRREFDVDHVNLNFEGHGRIGRFLSTINSLCKVVTKMVREHPRLVYLTVSRSKLGCIKDCFFVVIARLFNARVIVHLHGGNLTAFYDRNGFILKWILRTIYKHISYGIVLGESLKKQFERLLPSDRVRVVPNCYPSHEIKVPLERSRRDNSGSLRVLFLSNVLPSKGLFDALKGVSIAIKRHVPIEFIFVGEFLNHDGDLAKLHEYAEENVNAESIEKRYETFIKRLGIMHCVKRVGTIQGQAKWDILLSSDIFLLPVYNPYEGQPITILEAMRSGCALVTTSCGGIVDIMEDGITGRIVRPRCPEDIGDALEWIWKNPAWLEDVSKKNHQRAMVKHSPKAHVSALTRVFEEALGLTDRSPSSSIEEVGQSIAAK